MATRVYNQEEITLQDDTEVVLKPLPIAPLRRFMEAWNQAQNLPDDDDGYRVFINCCGIALEKNFKGTGKFESLKANKEEQEAGEFLSAEYKEYLEDTLELDSIYKIMDVCGGIKFDPKLQEEAMRVAMAEQLGKSST